MFFFKKKKQQLVHKNFRKPCFVYKYASMEVGQVFVSSDVIGSLCGDVFRARATHFEIGRMSVVF